MYAEETAAPSPRTPDPEPEPVASVASVADADADAGEDARAEGEEPSEAPTPAAEGAGVGEDAAEGETAAAEGEQKDGDDAAAAAPVEGEETAAAAAPVEGEEAAADPVEGGETAPPAATEGEAEPATTTEGEAAPPDGEEGSAEPAADADAAAPDVEPGAEPGATGEAPEPEPAVEDAPPPPPPRTPSPPPPPEPAYTLDPRAMKLKVALGSLPEDAASAPAAFFLKDHADDVIDSASALDAVQHGLLSEGTSSLVALEQMLAQVFVPLFGAQAGGIGGDALAQDILRELGSSTGKFGSQVTHAVQQLCGDITLNVPNVAIESVEKALDDYEVVNALEAAMLEWTEVLRAAVERETEKTPQGRGPLAEIDYWRERGAALTGLFEQLNLPAVRKMIEVIEAAPKDKVVASVFTGFKHEFEELHKLYLECKDNVKFLTTLERHFKAITNYRQTGDGSLSNVTDVIGPMLNALRMVWIISRHYSDDARMGGLMNRISVEIGDKVTEDVCVEEIFDIPVDEAIAKVDNAKRLLETWKETYMEVREKIETSGNARWEFNRKELFDRTDYMASICGDLRGMLEAVDGFHHFLGPQLKAVTGENEAIDVVLSRVKEMAKPVEDVDFDAFDQKYMMRWQTISSQFQCDKEEIERSTRSFIDESFKNLRSAESAFELLQNFKSIKSEGGISKQLQDKFNDVLEQFARELQVTRDIFDKNHEDPPVYKNQPPVAGAIAWSRSLFSRVRKTMTMFETHAAEEMKTEAAAAECHFKYMAIAKSVMHFEKKQYNGWIENVDAAALYHLKQPILYTDTSCEPEEIKVNFHHDLVKLIREAKYLDKMGFKIPETALNVALQDEKYLNQREQMMVMLNAYKAAVTSLTPVEATVFSEKLKRLRAVLQPGYSPLNWNSLGILEFVEKCKEAINEFASLVTQVKKNGGVIEQVAADISAARVVFDPPVGAETLDATEMFEHLERHRTEVVDELVRKYRTIGPLLGKIEEAVAGTNTGKSPQLAEYYAHWESAIFNALSDLVMNNLRYFAQMLDRRTRAKTGKHGPGPLFKVIVMLNAPDIVVQPSIKDVAKALKTSCRNVLECAAPFVRWMDRTCLETPPVKKDDDDDEPVYFNFMNDVGRDEDILRVMEYLNDQAEKTVQGVSEYVESWNKHAYLWKLDKEVVVAKFVETEPDCMTYEREFAKYQKMSNELFEASEELEIDYARVVCRPLGKSLREECLSWVKAFATEMHRTDVESVGKIRGDIADKDRGLRAEPADINDLIGVLSIIDDVRRGHMQMELDYLDLEERVRTRQLYDFPMEEASVSDHNTIRDIWATLRKDCEEMDNNLDEVRDKFTLVTIDNVKEFKEKCADFRKRLEESGPGVPGTELDVGVTSLAAYNEELAFKLKTRDDLVMAEKLFELDVTSYPELTETENELKVLDQIYGLYVAHVDGVAGLATAMWKDLDFAKLVDFAKDFAERLEAMLGTDLERSPIFALVSEVIESFRSTLPAIESLKSESMRERHWEQLQSVTATSVNTDPNVFTLGMLLGMKIHLYSSGILDMCTAAEKEVKIEADIVKLADVWKHQKFELLKYVKGEEDRGFTLRSTDEVTVTLDDMALTLQSMMSSRYAKPFIDDVRAWEAKLSLISEVIEVWNEVQRKWMYLESIFIGSDDIRHQLPEEAKRFDRIEKHWQMLMADTTRTATS